MDSTVALEKTKMHPKKAILWLSMVSMMMIFGGLTSAMIVSKKPGWFAYELPTALWIGTAILLISSISMNWTLSAARKNNFLTVLLGSMTTLVLGLVFAYLQWETWEVLVDEGIFFSGGDTSASFLYVLTGFHLVHLVAGLIALFVIVYGARKRKYHADKIIGLELAAIYWHFLDGLWLYLFLFILYIR